jgi:hypothetical protein
MYLAGNQSNGIHGTKQEEATHSTPLSKKRKDDGLASAGFSLVHCNGISLKTKFAATFGPRWAALGDELRTAQFPQTR